MDKTIAHALKNPIQSRGRNTISRMAALIKNKVGQEVLGWNKYKTHPLMFRFSQDHEKICLHAELDALVKFVHYDEGFATLFKPYEIYIARVLKNGQPALAKPCETCFGALTYFGIREIWYTTDSDMWPVAKVYHT